MLRTVIELGITHIDTSDYYGPFVTNEIIREALHPYPSHLHIVTKIGALRDSQGNRPQSLSRAEVIQAVHDDLQLLGPDVLDMVNLRFGGTETPTPGWIAEPFTVLAELQQQGIVPYPSISTVNAEQVTEAQSIAPIVFVQNFYNIANRGTTLFSTPSPARASPSFRTSPSEVSRRCSPTRSARSRSNSRPPKWPRLSRGCCGVRRISC